MDISKLSDKELMAIANGSSSNQTKFDITNVSDEELLAIANQAPQQQPQLKFQSSLYDDQGPVYAAMRNALNEATFGYGKNAVAGLRSLIGGNDYEKELAYQRNQLAGDIEQYPVTSTAAGIGGAVGISIAATPARVANWVGKGGTFLQRAGRLSAVGAPSGALYATGNRAEGESIPEAVVRGGVTGAALGPVGVVAGDVIAGGVKGAQNLVRGVGDLKTRVTQGLDGLLGNKQVVQQVDIPTPASQVQEYAPVLGGYTRESGVRMSKGQATGNLEAQKAEEQIKKGLGGPEALSSSQTFAEAQKRDIYAQIRTVTGADPDTLLSSSYNPKMEGIKDTVVKTFKKDKDAVNQLFNNVSLLQKKNGNVVFDKSMVSDFNKALDSWGSKLLPSDLSSVKKEFSDLAEIAKNEKRPLVLDDLTAIREKINRRARGLRESDPQLAYNLNDVKGLFDNFISKKIDTHALLTNQNYNKNSNVVSDNLIMDSVNPTGSIFTKYNPNERAKAVLADNITTLDKTMNVDPDKMVTIYRGAPKTQKSIVSGDFVTTNPQLARDYAGDGVVLSKKVRANEILDDKNEPLMEEYIFRPSVSNVEKNISTSSDPYAVLTAYKDAVKEYRAFKTKYDGTPLIQKLVKEPDMVTPETFMQSLVGGNQVKNDAKVQLDGLFKAVGKENAPAVKQAVVDSFWFEKLRDATVNQPINPASGESFLQVSKIRKGIDDLLENKSLAQSLYTPKQQKQLKSLSVALGKISKPQAGVVQGSNTFIQLADYMNKLGVNRLPGVSVLTSGLNLIGKEAANNKVAGAVKNFQPSPESLEKVFATPPQSLATLMALVSQSTPNQESR
jgi:hypothetical protein